MIIAIIGDDKEKLQDFASKQDERRHTLNILIPDVEYTQEFFNHAYKTLRDSTLVVAGLLDQENVPDGIEALLSFAKLSHTNMIYL